MKSLGQSPRTEDNFDEPAQFMYASLGTAEALQGLKLRETVVSLLRTTADLDVLLGAMYAAYFYSSYGYVAIWPDAFEAIVPLSDHPDREIRTLALEIRASCAPG
jgi:hypothetical protein